MWLFAAQDAMVSRSQIVGGTSVEEIPKKGTADT